MEMMKLPASHAAYRRRPAPGPSAPRQRGGTDLVPPVEPSRRQGSPLGGPDPRRRGRLGDSSIIRLIRQRRRPQFRAGCLLERRQPACVVTVRSGLSSTLTSRMLKPASHCSP
jgi:hypothetical protein